METIELSADLIFFFLLSLSLSSPFILSLSLFLSNPNWWLVQMVEIFVQPAGINTSHIGGHWKQSRHVLNPLQEMLFFHSNATRISIRCISIISSKLEIHMFNSVFVNGFLWFNVIYIYIDFLNSPLPSTFDIVTNSIRRRRQQQQRERGKKDRNCRRIIFNNLPRTLRWYGMRCYCKDVKRFSQYFFSNDASSTWHR